MAANQKRSNSATEGETAPAGGGARAAAGTTAPAVRVNDFVIRVANVNGSGSASANSLLYKSIFRAGIPVSAKNIFPSNVQGLPTWFEIRVNADGHTARSPRVDFMIAMNPHTAAEDMLSVSPGGYYLYDSTWPMKEVPTRGDVTLLPVPLTELSVEAFPDVKTRILLRNITYVGAAAAFLSIDLEIMRTLLNETYAKKPHLIDANMQAISMSHDHVTANYEAPLPVRVEGFTPGAGTGAAAGAAAKDTPGARPATAGTILMNGNTACALGCLYAGATVAAWYPITPATSLTDAFKQLCESFRKDPKTGKLNAAIVQAEDELSAAGMAVGAAWAGARAFTPTSGAGISLMSEFIGFAYFTEIPVVFFDVQRVGPSTGMPTRTQQGDIMTAAYASHGDTKHIVLFPGNPEECFYLSAEAFDHAERYQTPVLVLSDLDMGMNDWMTKRLEWDDAYRPDRGKVLSAWELEEMKEFHRYLDVDGDGIPYRTLPGVHPTGAYFLRGSGHNKYGKYTEKSEEYIEVVDRLLRKLDTAKPYLPAPILELAPGEADDRPPGIITIGSCDLAVREAMERLGREGHSFDYLRIRSFPFHPDVEAFLADHNHCYVVEQNRDGQLRSLLILETDADKRALTSILSYGGMPIDADAVTEKLRAALRAQAEAERERQGGTHGESEIEAEVITSEHQTE